MIPSRVITCIFVVFTERIIFTTTSPGYPSLFESALKYLQESLEWDSNEIQDIKHVLPEYDFIVVGAGSAGSVVASRLSEVSGRVSI